MRRILVALILLSSQLLSFAGEKITSLHLGNEDITDITSVSVRKDGKIVIFSGLSATISDPDKVPPYFLTAWGITTNSIEDIKQKELEKAISSGKFRIVGGVVYDLRQKPSGWVSFQNVQMVQKLDDDEAIFDATPDSAAAAPIHVVHFTQASFYGDKDRFNFSGMLAGNYSYVNKLGDDRTIRTYDAGRVAAREDLPDAILKDGKPYALLDLTTGVQRSSLGDLPETRDLLCSGTAFFITDDGYLITNDHVVRGVRKVRVKTRNSYLDAIVVKTDQEVDLALLKVSGAFSPLPLELHKDLGLGDDVFTIGFPNVDMQGIEPKYTDGRVSSLAGLRDDPSRCQISVPVQPGNSGGPLVDSAGAVAGVIVGRLNDMLVLAESGSMPQNVNYAIKGSSLREFLRPIHELEGKLKSQSVQVKRDDVIRQTRDSVVLVLGYK